MDRPSLAEALARALDARAEQIHTEIPATVISYNANSQVAVVRPSVWPDGEELPVLVNVPVAWPSGSAGYLHIGLGAGDTGLLMALEADIARWRRTGEAGAPEDLARHHWQSAVFLPGGVRTEDGKLDGHAANVSLHSTALCCLGDWNAVKDVPYGTDWRDAFAAWAGAVRLQIIAAGGGDIAGDTATLLAAWDAALSTKVRVK